MVMIRQQKHWDTNTKNGERSDYNEHVNTTCCFLVGWELQSAPKPDLIRPYFPPWCINSTLSELAGDVYIGQILKGTESPNIKMNPGILDWDAMLRSSQSRRSKFPGWNVQLPISKSRYTTPNADKNYSWLCVTKQCSFGCNWTFTSVSLGIILGNVSKYSNHFTFFWQLLCREDDFQRLFNITRYLTTLATCSILTSIYMHVLFQLGTDNTTLPCILVDGLALTLCASMDSALLCDVRQLALPEVGIDGFAPSLQVVTLTLSHGPLYFF